MSKFQQLLDAYGVSHKNKTNKLIHWICVPAIFFSIVGLISVIPFPWNVSIIENISLNWAFIALALVLIYYVSLSISISIGSSSKPTGANPQFPSHRLRRGLLSINGSTGAL